MNQLHKWSWLGDHLAVDFANTTIRREADPIDLIETVDAADEWIEREPADLPAVSMTDSSLVELRTQRDATNRLLRASIRGERLEQADIELINTLVVNGRAFRLLASRARESRISFGSGFSSFAGVLAESVVDLLARDDLAAIAICEAPSCGQIFHRSRVNQKWCSPGCGNRARVDRHRHQNPRAQRSSRSS